MRQMEQERIIYAMGYGILKPLITGYFLLLHIPAGYWISRQSLNGCFIKEIIIFTPCGRNFLND
jgi:hypothetical protein